jgi:hypothetical protein
MVDGPTAKLAFQQLADLQAELRESGTVRTCLSGRHDDFVISCTKLAWAARHPHLEHWFGTALRSRQLTTCRIAAAACVAGSRSREFTALRIIEEGSW